MKTKCALCGKKVAADFLARWRHVGKNHPDVLASRLLPMVFNPAGVRDLGFQIGQKLRGLL